MITTEDESRKWRPALLGWSDDILPFYQAIAAELPNPCTVVEVGSAHGRSAIFLASVLLAMNPAHGSQSKIYMVDDWGGGWFVECLPSILEHVKAGELELLRPVRATSKQAVRMFEQRSLDMVFVDGDHSRIGCADDLEMWVGTVKRHGIFAGHDYDENAHPGVFAAVNAFGAAHAISITHPTRSVWRAR